MSSGSEINATQNVNPAAPDSGRIKEEQFLQALSDAAMIGAMTLITPMINQMNMDFAEITE